jgi:hypothetical protein
VIEVRGLRVRFCDQPAQIYLGMLPRAG